MQSKKLSHLVRHGTFNDDMPRNLSLSFYNRLKRNSDLYLLLYNTIIYDDLEESAKRDCLEEGVQQHGK